LLAEIDENLVRADLSPAERAMHVGRRKELYEKLHPETKTGGAPGAGKGKGKRKRNANLASFQDQTAKSTGQSKRKVARDATRAKHIVVLAEIAGTVLDQGDELDAMAKLPEAEQRKLAARAKAGEKVTAKTRAKQIKRAEREVKLAAKISALPDIKAGLIAADPAWKFRNVWSEAGMDRSPENQYPCEELDKIKKLPVQSITADDCVLFLWTTVAHEADGHEVLKAWGFTYVSQLVWVKDQIGLGYWFRNKHEILLVGVKGKPVAPAPGTQWPSVIEAPVREHSRKPDEFYEMMEAYFPTVPKIELNCRGKPRPGWSAWGNEAE
jgi:N6-adenosine-specific RNA methylase IME4